MVAIKNVFDKGVQHRYNILSFNLVKNNEIKNTKYPKGAILGGFYLD